MIRHLIVLIGAIAALYPFAGQGFTSDYLRITPVGYRVGAAGEIVQSLSSNAVEVSPQDDPCVVEREGPSTNFIAKAGFGYKVVAWQRFTTNPIVRASEPETLTPEDPTQLEVAYDDAGWIYLVVVLEEDPARTLTLSKSPFGEGTIGTNYGTYACLKGDVFRLQAIPTHDDKTGFDYSTFRRWSDGVTSFQRTITVVSNETYVAEFVPKSWEVSFDGAGGTVSPGSKTVTCGATYGRLPTPLRTGYAFLSWQDAAKDGQVVASDTIVGAVGDHTLYAAWEAQQYTIGCTFSGTGSGTVDGTGAYSYGTTILLTAKAIEGSAFTGWTDGETRNPRHVSVVSNAMYDASFALETYRVTFTYCDESGNEVVTEPQTVTYGGAATPPDPLPVWPDHPFSGWSNEAYRNVTYDLTGDRSVTALYSAKHYPVRFIYRNGQGLLMTNAQQNVVTGGSAVPPPASVYDNWVGHSFEGWQPDYSVITTNTDIEAVYSTNVYTVTFSYMGSDGQLKTKETKVAYEDVVSLDQVAGLKNQWPGHTFVCWSCNGQVVDEATGIKVTSDIEIAAVYEGYARIRYTGGEKGEGAMETQVLTNNFGGVQLTSNAFTRVGYTFGAWETSDGELYKDGALINVEDGDEIVLTATWEPIEYTLAFDGNGGTCTLESRRLIYDSVWSVEYDGGLVTRPTGYRFKGWSTNSTAKTADYRWSGTVNDLQSTNLTTVADSTVTLFAVWVGEPAVITVDVGSGTPRTVDTAYGAEIQESDLGETPTKEGHAFLGWSTNGVMVTFPLTITSTALTLKAEFEPLVYEISFDAAGGAAIGVQSNVYGTVVTLPDATGRTGYTFVEWKEGTTSFASDTTMPAHDVRLTASWQANTYWVRYHAGEGTGEMTDQEFLYDVAQALKSSSALTPPAKMAFDGWTNSAGRVFADEEIVSNLTAVANGSVDLYAVWSDVPNYTIRYDGNGATDGTMPDQVVFCGRATPLLPNAYERLGYTFAAWTNLLNGATYTNRQAVTDLAVAGATNTLQAVWSNNAYTVVFSDARSSQTHEQSFVYDQPQALEPNAFQRTGYTFAGWATNEVDATVRRVKYADGAVVSNLTAIADDSVPLFAAWSPITYTLRLHPNGGTGEILSMTLTYDVATNLSGVTFGPPEGKRFSAWTNGVWTIRSTDTISNLTSVAEGVVDLYAYWVDAGKYTVRFEPGEAGGAPAEQTLKCNAGEALRSNSFVYVGHSFKEWARRDGIATYYYADGAIVTNLAAEGETAVLTAQWSVNQYTYEFKDYSSVPQKKSYGAVINDPNYTRKGYSLTWQTNGVSVTFPFVMPAHDVVFEHVDTPITYTIAFDGNGAEGGSMAPTNVAYDAAVTLPTNEFVRTDFAFDCWTNDVGAAFADGAVVTNLTAELGKTVWLYAKWKVARTELQRALGEDFNLTAEVDEGSWTIVGDGEGVRKTAESGDGQLRIKLTESGSLKLTIQKSEQVNTGSLTVRLSENPSLNLKLAPRALPYDIDNLTAGTLIIEGKPTAGSWTLKNFRWTAEGKED